MSSQVEPETMAWLKLRQTNRNAIAAAMVSGDFSAVPAQPYKAAAVGTDGFPAADVMTQKLLDGYSQPDTLTSADQVSIQLQVNTLESFRRAYLGLKQGRRELFAHENFDLTQAPKFDNLMLQQFIGTAKVVTSDG